MTHGPPHGIWDKATSGHLCGDAALLREIQERVHPDHHLFGHIHEDVGVKKVGETTFVNASTCTYRYKPTNPPYVFDIALT